MPPATDHAAAVPTITVRAPKGGRRRAGRRWPEGETTVETAMLRRDQLDALAADPVLIVTHGQRLIGEAEAGAHPPVGTMERDDLNPAHVGIDRATVAEISRAVQAPAYLPADPDRPGTVAADAVAPVPDSTIPGTQAAVSGAIATDGASSEAEIAEAADEAVEAAIRMLQPDSYGANGMPKVDSIRAVFSPADRHYVTAEVRDRVWGRMTADGFKAPANSGDEPG